MKKKKYSELWMAAEYKTQEFFQAEAQLLNWPFINTTLDDLTLNSFYCHIEEKFLAESRRRIACLTQEASNDESQTSWNKKWSISKWIFHNPTG